MYSKYFMFFIFFSSFFLAGMEENEDGSRNNNDKNDKYVALEKKIGKLKFTPSLIVLALYQLDLNDADQLTNIQIPLDLRLRLLYLPNAVESLSRVNLDGLSKLDHIIDDKLRLEYLLFWAAHLNAGDYVRVIGELAQKAVKINNTGILGLLEKLGINLNEIRNCFNQSLWRIMLLFITTVTLEMVEFFMEHDIKPDLSNFLEKFDLNLLINRLKNSLKSRYGADSEKQERLEKVLEYLGKFDFSAIRKQKQKELRDAASIGNIFTVTRLVDEENIKVDGQDGEGYTALMLAARNGYTEVVQFLLEHGVATTITNRRGETAIQMAQQTGQQHIIDLIEQYRVRPGTDRRVCETSCGFIGEPAVCRGTYRWNGGSLHALAVMFRGITTTAFLPIDQDRLRNLENSIDRLVGERPAGEGFSIAPNDPVAIDMEPFFRHEREVRGISLTVQVDTDPMPEIEFIEQEPVVVERITLEGDDLAAFKGIAQSLNDAHKKALLKLVNLCYGLTAHGAV